VIGKMPIGLLAGALVLAVSTTNASADEPSETYGCIRSGIHQNKSQKIASADLQGKRSCQRSSAPRAQINMKPIKMEREVWPASLVPQLLPLEVDVPGFAPYELEVQRHVMIVMQSAEIREWLNRHESKLPIKVSAGKVFGRVDLETEETNALKVLAPYAVADIQAIELMSQSFILDSHNRKKGPLYTTAQICINGTNCTEVDPMTAAMMLIHAVSDSREQRSSNRQQKEDKYTSTTCGAHLTIKIGDLNLCEALDYLRDKPVDNITGGLFPQIRKLIIRDDDRSEISMFLRDPIKRPVEIVIALRDRVLPGNGEGEKIIREPIKCTIGRFFKMCPG
jgi:hypothetical protein